MKLLRAACLSAATFIFLSSESNAAQNTVRGRIINGQTNTPVLFGLVIIQEAGIVVNATNGNYYAELPGAGIYTLKIQVQGLHPVTVSLMVQGSVVRDFTLSPVVEKKQGVIIKGERDIQKVSRQTMTVRQIKDTPASFGDSLNALTALPGVNRVGNFFGPLIIRGALSSWNGYYIDDIPLYKPMHFGGIHSVINNDLMRDIDLYSSAYPSQFSNAQAAVININTIDEVKQFGGNADIGLISANALVKAPITTETVSEDGVILENRGYIIAAARYGYLSLVIPLYAKLFLGKDINILPEYWDYQFKAKYDFNKRNSITFLAFGNKDFWKIIIKEGYLDEGSDPLFKNVSFRTDDQSHSQGIYYTFQPGDNFKNTLLAYSVLNKSYMWLDIPESTEEWARGINITSKPYIFGVKDKIKLEWIKSHAELRAGVEATQYYFRTHGKTVGLKNSVPEGGFGDMDDYVSIYLGDSFRNNIIAGYAENKFTFGGLTFVPGFHSEYLASTGESTFDPRGTITYSFSTGTTVGFAGGWYSMFMQTSPEFFNTNPDIAGADYLKAQRSLHRSASIEQKISDYTFKIEGFYNYFEDFVMSDNYTASDGTTRYYRNCGHAKSAGVEFLLKISDERDQGLFGWASYTYNRATYISNQLPSFDAWGDTWITSPWDMTHVVKAVAGYIFGSHSISSRFTYNTSTPYTAITGSHPDPYYSGRIIPEYGKPNTERFNPSYRLDLRYSYKTSYKWGFVSWYFEIVGAISSKAEQYVWDWRREKSSTNPRIEKTRGIENIPIPNFGVEVKF